MNERDALRNAVRALMVEAEREIQAGHRGEYGRYIAAASLLDSTRVLLKMLTPDPVPDRP